MKKRLAFIIIIMFISGLSGDMSQNSTNVEASINELNQLAQELKQTVDQFKIAP